MKDADLTEIERRVQKRLRGERADLVSIGAGEVSAVMAWPNDRPQWACKRLPPLRTREALERHKALVIAYEDALVSRGIACCRSSFFLVPCGGGLTALYMVQPLLPADSLLSTILRKSKATEGMPASFQAVLAAIDHADERFGIDAQVSNWAETAEGITLIDTTTPFLRDDQGEDRLDGEILIRTYPALVRLMSRHFLLKDIIDAYHDPRKVAVDLLANFYREGLDAWVEAASQAIGNRYGSPIAPDEALAYYRSNTRTWRFLNRTQRAQRFFYRRILRRTYPYVLRD